MGTRLSEFGHFIRNAICQYLLYYHYLPNDIRLPIVYNTANAFNPPPNGNIVRITDPSIEHSTPTPKQIQKPLILVPQDKVEASRA